MAQTLLVAPELSPNPPPCHRPSRLWANNRSDNERATVSLLDKCGFLGTGFPRRYAAFLAGGGTAPLQIQRTDVLLAEGVTIIYIRSDGP